MTKPFFIVTLTNSTTLHKEAGNCKLSMYPSQGIAGEFCASCRDHAKRLQTRPAAMEEV